MGPKYGSAYLGIALVTQVVVQWVTYFYAPPLGRGEALLPIAFVGLAMIIGRVIDALADPIVGVWSDNSAHPKGRRIPFILYGMVPLALFFALLWTPIGESVTFRFVYLTVVLGLFFFFFTVVAAPYLALLPELAKGTKERLSLSAWQAFFNIVGLAVAMIGSSYLVSVYGFSTMGWSLGLVALVSFAITAFSVKERSHARLEKTQGIVESVRITLRNKPFLIFVVGQLGFWFGFNMAMIIIPYVVTVLMGLDESMVGIILGLALLVAMVSFPVVVKATSRFGYKRALVWTMGLQAVVLLALGTIGISALPSWYGYFIIALAGLPLAGLFVIPNAMLAEITDYDYSLTGRRREAIYFGVQGLVLKSAMGLSSVVVTNVLNVFGYSPGQALGIRLSGPIAGFFVFIGMLVLLRYPESIMGPNGDFRKK